MKFTDYYAEKSCTAGRSSFITGQTPKRTGLSKVGHARRAIGRSALPRDITIAEALKALGYATGQFGKNHLGDRNEYPAVRARLRRILRQPLPSECRGGAGAPLLAEGCTAFTSAIRAARRAQMQGHRQGRPDGGAAWGRSASRPSRIPVRSPASGWRRSTTRPPPRRMDYIQRQAQANKPFFVLDEHDAHACLHACAASRCSGQQRHARQRVRRRHDRAR